MGKRPHEKNVIILIEGQSERRAFELALPDLFSRISDDYRIHFPLLYEDNTEKGGDITAKTGITPITIEGCIAKLFIAKILEETKIYTRDIKEIIHIVDLDGAYIPNENILCRINPTIAVKPYYEEAAIRTDNIQSIIDRNNRKRENIEALLSLPNGKIRVLRNPENPHSQEYTIPYSIYYFSSNLDHFLHHDANIDKEFSKVQLAECFRNGYINNLEGFCKYFIEDHDSAGELSYSESWEYIRQRGLNSLMRHTNIDILLKRLINAVR